MTLWTYRYFIDVVESKSFTKAGKKNFVSQTAISQQIASLEKTLGGKLLKRERSGLEITELGKVVYGRAKEMLSIEDELKKDIEKLQDKGILRIGVDTSIHNDFWEYIQKMLHVYYGGSVKCFEFSKINMTAASQMLEVEKLDMYIGYDVLDNMRESKLQVVSITSNNLGVFMSKEHPLAQETILTLDKLKEYPRYETKEYSCSMIAQVDTCEFIEQNLETMKLKVEFNEGYAFVDSQYFDCSSGIVKYLEQNEIECHIKAYYKDNHRRKKVEETLRYLEKTMR